VAVVGCALGVVPAALAQTPAAQSPPPATSPAAGHPGIERAPPPADEPVPEAPADGWLDFKGRVIAHARLAARPDVAPSEHLDLLVPSARFGVRALATPRLSLEIEVDVAGKPEMKDAYAQYRSKRWRLRAGHFKMPSLVITRASPWSLPLARRGTVNEVLVDYLLVAGRRPGVLAAWRGGGWLDPTLIVGAFQGSTWEPKADGDPAAAQRFETKPIEELGLRSAKPIVRFTMSPAGIELGAFAEWRPFPVGGGPLAYQWTVGLDATVDKEYAGHALRAWVEATAGSSWSDANWLDDDLTSFAAGRGLVAWRRGGLVLGERYVEPYVGANLLDPDTEIPDDLLIELVAGVNVGLWRRARVGVELSMLDTGPGIPPYRAYVKPSSPSPVRAHRAAILQAGVVF
jgi:hypothetical protein